MSGTSIIAQISMSLSDEVALNVLLNIDTCPDTRSINKQRLRQKDSPQR